MIAKPKLYKINFFEELVIFIAMFVLTMLHEWMKVDTFTDLLKGLVFFILLYSQAQLHRHLLFPYFLSKRYGLYITLLFITTLTASAILLALDYFWIAPEIFRDDSTSIGMGMAYHFVLCLISTFTILSLFLVRQYSHELNKRNETQLLLSQMNLKFLHAQLNPHFFFNMFNNLYGVSLTDPERTPGLILKLSELMRYQLESGNKELVTIGEEITFIENYIAMEQERIGKRCEINYSYPDNRKLLSNYTIAPLILITLVENAFKHSVTINNKWFVNILISIENDHLVIKINNSISDEKLKNPSTGIGLFNIKERLKMLYDSNYELSINADQHNYSTTLKLTLNVLSNG